MISSIHEKSISRTQTAIEAIAKGGMIIMVDDEDRENEGDLVLAGDHVSAEKINFMIREARGLVCLALEPEMVDRLDLPLMENVGKSQSPRATAFTVSIEAREGVTTGISAADRAQTIRVAINSNTRPRDLVVPGHIFPLRAKSGGVLERAGHTEGSVDIVRLAGCSGAGVICEIMNEDGSMARRQDLERFSEKHNIPIVTIADLVEFRLLKDSLIEPLAESDVVTEHGVFRGHLFKSLVDGSHHLALVKGSGFSDRITDVRVHRSRPLADVFGESAAGGRMPLEYGLNMLTKSDAAVFLSLSHPQSSEQLVEEFAALAQTKKPDSETEKAKDAASAPPVRVMDSRVLGIGAQILRHLGVRQMRVHQLSPRSLRGLSGFGLEIMDTVIMEKPAPRTLRTIK